MTYDYNWIRKYHKLAEFVANEYSKDPSTKVGAVTMGNSPNEVAFGYNGFAPGIEDKEERLTDRNQKLEYMIHAEENALINTPFKPKVIISTLTPCTRCANIIIANRVEAVFAPYPDWEKYNGDHWGKSITQALNKFGEAGVQVIWIPRKNDLDSIERIERKSQLGPNVFSRPYKYFTRPIYYHGVVSEMKEEHPSKQVMIWYEDILEKEKKQWLGSSKA